MIIRVRAKVTFEVEYSLDMDFYETDEIANAIAFDEDVFTRDPGLLLSLFEGEGKAIVNIEQVIDETA